MIDNEHISQTEDNFQEIGRDVDHHAEPVAPESPEQEPSHVAQEQTPAEQETPQQRNFRALREQTLRLEQEKAELARQLAAYQQQKQQESTEQEDNLAPDALIEKRHLSRYDKKIKDLEAQLKQYQEQSVAFAVENQLKTKYPDFDAIVNKDNIEMLKLTYPELAQTIYANPDLYSKGVSAYTIIKQMGIALNNDTDKQRATTNINKPRPLASFNSAQGNSSPLQRANAFANGLTEDLKAQLYKEMVESMKNI